MDAEPTWPWRIPANWQSPRLSPGCVQHAILTSAQAVCSCASATCSNCSVDDTRELRRGGVGLPLYLNLELNLPALDLPVVEQHAGAGAEVVVALHRPVAAPAEEGPAGAAGHLVAALALLDGHAAGGAPLGCLLQCLGCVKRGCDGSKSTFPGCRRCPSSIEENLLRLPYEYSRPPSSSVTRAAPGCARGTCTPSHAGAARPRTQTCRTCAAAAASASSPGSCTAAQRLLTVPPRCFYLASAFEDCTASLTS